MIAQHPIPDPFQQHIENCGKRFSDAVINGINERKFTYNWLEQLISRIISEPKFRIQSLRFIDVLPSLDNDKDLAHHLQEYFSGLPLPHFAEWGLKHSNTGWATRIAAPTVRFTLRGLARKFMGGHRLHHAMTSISRLRNQGMNFTLDLMGEATISETEGIAYQKQYLNMLSNLSEPINNWHKNDLLDKSHNQYTPRLNLSIKLSSLYSQIRSVAPEFSIHAICKRLRPILRLAISNNAFITIDMEQYDLKNIILGCFKQIIMEDEFKTWPNFGIAMQAYLKETESDIKNLISLTKKRNMPITIRLVRGAYWDYETVIARQNNWDCPVWENKTETDLNYEKCLTIILTSHQDIHTAIATHNPRSIAYAMALTEKLKLDIDQFEFQMLYGMADTLKTALVKLDYRLRIYVPFGETLPGMAYLVRRLLENSSGQSMIDSGFDAPEKRMNNRSFDAPIKIDKKMALTSVNDLSFKNCAMLRFITQQQCDEFQFSIDRVKEQLGDTYPLIINGQQIHTNQTIKSYNPAQPSQLIGIIASANNAHADGALKAAEDAFIPWKNTPMQQRADYLRRVAALLSQRRMEFAAWQIFEAGKNWQEADGDICEAIDFLNYYAEQAEIIDQGRNVNICGEHNHFSYRPCGVCLIIPPWNFPIAIMCGMLSAAIVTGNTAIVKPSSLTPIIASKFIQLWQDINIPNGVINFLPGPGKHIGDYLAKKSSINIIAFTGSLNVGKQLLSIAAHIQPNQFHIKKIIAEMGGKNAIIVDSDADLDDAVIGVAHSAFGFQGQKCSAASRVIVIGSIYNKFIRRLVETTQSLTIGPPEEPHNFIGPVIDKIAYKKIKSLIQQEHSTALVHNNNSVVEASNGYYINPCIFTDVDPLSSLAQEEIFGPVLCVIKADSFEQAIDIANNSKYALTGGVYSRQPSHLKFAEQNFNVGNLYLNRKITGAMVGRQPFGGLKMSGAGNCKAGNAEYLLQFMNAYCITENTLRRGFAPEPDEEFKNPPS